MGEAKRRGDFEQRKAQAIQARRIKVTSPKLSKLIHHHALLWALMAQDAFGIYPHKK